MDLYLYSAFLVLMTTQSSLQYSFIFTQSHTHSYTLLFYEARFGASCSRTLWHADCLGRLGIKLPTFRLEDDHSTPSATVKVGNQSVYMSLWVIRGWYLHGCFLSVPHSIESVRRRHFVQNCCHLSLWITSETQLYTAYTTFTCLAACRDIYT